MKAVLILFATGIVVLFAGFLKKRSMLLALALLGVGLALGVVAADLWMGSYDGLNSQFKTMLHFDRFALAFSAVALTNALLLLGLSRWGFRELSETLGDNYALILFSLCGALCMFAFNNIVMLFLGIEILSIPLYVLAGSRRDNLASNEAALKYFLMGSFATGILLFGIALMYGATASFDLQAIAAALEDGRHSAPMLHTGILLILTGLGFKIAAAPFHFWAPDVYQGSPNMITAYMATVVKTAGVGAFFKLFSVAFAAAMPFWALPVAMIAGLTILLANFTALFQTDFKRLMAYSSVAHAGYLLLGILSIGQDGATGALLLYLLVYGIASICAFAVYMIVTEDNPDSSISAFNGLGKKQPLLAAAMTICVLSLAGIPPTAGFFGKYFLFALAFEHYPWLVALAVVGSAVSIYYYFKVLVAMYFSREQNEHAVPMPMDFRLVLLAGVALIAMLALAPGFVYGLI
jgi:NADH-quinone oxidoreductase subunit N